MADVTRATILVVLCFISVKCGVLSGKELFCRDPDTGKLHAVNTTWASTTFCGNYTCKFRKRNSTQTENVSLEKIDNTKPIEEIENHGDATTTVFTIEKKPEPGVQTILHRDRVSDVSELKINSESATSHQGDSEDRYLTDTEINSISKLLHTVKKSDLDAIVEIYKLAQDIYSEIDRSTTESILDETFHSLKHNKVGKVKTVKNFYDKKRKSFWYDPISNNYKVKPMDVMEYQESNAIPTTIQPKRDVLNRHSTGANEDYGIQTYYYPISSFQRLSSYINRQETEKKMKPCDQRKEATANVNAKKIPYLFESQKLIQPSLLLPYPFAYIHHYNASSYPSNAYFSGDPWAQYNNYNRNRNYQPFYKAYIAQVPNNAILINPDLNYDIQDAGQKPIVQDGESKHTKGDNMPEWQTSQIPAHVLEEVRANVDANRLIKPFSLRKKVKLEKVGKVLKLDEFVRSKRSIVEEQRGETRDNEYETYLEKITCQSETTPGYFRYGNMSRPYPECCPQRITEIK